MPQEIQLLQIKIDELSKSLDSINQKISQIERDKPGSPSFNLNRYVDEDTKQIIRELNTNVGVPVVSGLQYYSDRYDAGNSSTSLTIDFDNGNCQKVTLTGNCTFTFSNPKAGARYLLELKQDGTGSRLVTFPATVKWAGGIAPTLTTTAGQTDIVTLYYSGTNYVAISSLDFAI